MGKTVPDLKEIFKQAAEIAGHLPENLQVAAFNRALDLLAGVDAQPVSPTRDDNPKRGGSKPKSVGHPIPSSVGGIEALIKAIDSTKHPGVRSAGKVLDRALLILQIALREHGVDGLAPSAIATILTDKFRLGTSNAAVRMSLGNATNLVNRVPVGQGFVYRIMGPGEEYLAHLGEERDATIQHKGESRTRKVGAGRKTVRGRVGTVRAPRNESSRSPAAKSKPSGSSSKVASSKPKAAVLALLSAGYFASPRTVPQVQQYLRSNRGHTFETDSLHMIMLRLVRDDVLERSENGEKQYEYKKAG